MAGSLSGSKMNGHINGEPSSFDTAPSFEISFPQRDTNDDILQDAEVFDVVVKQRIRIHDYETLFSYPQLYEYDSSSKSIFNTDSLLAMSSRIHFAASLHRSWSGS